MELAESGMRYTQMPHVMEVGYITNFIHIHFCCHVGFFSSGCSGFMRDTLSIFKLAVEKFFALTYHYEVNVDYTIKWLQDNDAISVEIGSI